MDTSQLNGSLQPHSDSTCQANDLIIPSRIQTLSKIGTHTYAYRILGLHRCQLLVKFKWTSQSKYVYILIYYRRRCDVCLYYRRTGLCLQTKTMTHYLSIQPTARLTSPVAWHVPTSSSKLMMMGLAWCLSRAGFTADDL